jgi:polar amino acid transport system permease protein
MAQNSTDAADHAPIPFDDRPPLPARNYGRAVATVVVLVLLAALLHSIATNPNFHWPVVWKYFTAEVILEGAASTIKLTAAVMLLAVSLGIVLAVMRTSQAPLLRYSSAVYIWLFRGVPALVQILIWFNLASLYPYLSIAIPFGPELYSVQANDVVTPWSAALLGLGLCEAAYMAEIVRAGILSIDEGQSDAARALGMSRALMFRRIVLPQALRVIIPPTGNETIGMLKYTSIASVISVHELLRSAEIIYSRTFEIIPLLFTASIWYLICTTALTIVQHFIEQHFGRGHKRREQGRLMANLSAVKQMLLDRLRASAGSVPSQEPSR